MNLQQFCFVNRVEWLLKKSGAPSKGIIIANYKQARKVIIVNADIEEEIKQEKIIVHQRD